MFNRIVLFGSVVLFASARRNAEHSLRQQGARLEQALASERIARGTAEAASRMKDDFLATVSHELRTPLNAILGWAATLKRHAVDEQTSRQAIEAIERNGQAQARIVDDILDFSSIVKGRLKLRAEPVALAAIVREAIETVRLSAAAKGIVIEPSLDADAVVPGDPDRLRQIIWNLLSNAVKFTPGGGRIYVRLTREGAGVRLQVEDTGAGIDPAFLPHVFDPFRQADSSMTRPHGGLGLGLAIVRHLVELHGGTITVENAGARGGADVARRSRVHAAAAGRRQWFRIPSRARRRYTDALLGGLMPGRRVFSVLTLLVGLAACKGAKAPTAPAVTATSVAVNIAGNASTTLAPGDTRQLSATAAQSNGTTIDVTTLAAWQTSPASIATVSPAGLLTATAEGTVDVTARYGAASGTLRAEVRPTCAVSIAPATAAYGAFGGSATVNVTVNSASCRWSARSDATWFPFVFDAANPGSGSFSYSLPPNSTPVARAAALTIETSTGQRTTHTITEDRPLGCSYVTVPEELIFTASGGSGQFTVVTTPGDCTWSVVNGHVGPGRLHHLGLRRIPAAFWCAIRSRRTPGASTRTATSRSPASQGSIPTAGITSSS